MAIAHNLMVVRMVPSIMLGTMRYWPLTRGPWKGLCFEALTYLLDAATYHWHVWSGLVGTR